MPLEPLLKDDFLVTLEDGTEISVCNQAKKVPNITGSGKPYFHTGNLGAHLKRKRTSTNPNQTAMDLFVSVSTEIPKKKLFQIELSRDEIESAAIEAVTINGLPLSVFEKTGICKLLIPILDKLDITLNRASMKDRVLLQANQLRKQIAAEVEGKHICLKVDIASRNERGFLGINIQYIQEGCLRLRTLAVKELFERQTGNEIKRCILDVLESFRVNTIHVYSGAHLVCAGPRAASDCGAHI